MMVVAGIGIAVNAATALLFMRGREADLNLRGALLNMAADALVSAGVVVAGGLTLWFGWTWLDLVVQPADRRRHRGGQLETVQAVAAPAVRRRTKGRGPACGAGAAGIAARRTAGARSTRLGDGPSEIAMTAHRVMPQGQADDAFLKHATDASHGHVAIEHMTIQVVPVPCKTPCAVAGTAPIGPAARVS
jgi:cobalt-zinc-cadmium efflux system protein